jgi:hypothetical protein
MVAFIVMYEVLQLSFTLVQISQRHEIKTLYQQADRDTFQCVQNATRIQIEANALKFVGEPQIIFIGIVTAPRYVSKRDAMRMS